MATYDSKGNLLDEAPGLGFASAPNTQIMAPASGDAGVAERIGFAPTATSGMQPAAQPQSLGFATPEQPQRPQGRSQADQDYIKSLPDVQQFGLALGEFAAHLEGKESPVDKLLSRKKAEDARNQQYLLHTIEVIQKGTDVLRKMPEGMARDALAEQLGKSVGGGDIAEVFKAAGTQAKEIKEVLSTFSDPDVQTQLMKACSGKPDFGSCVMTNSRDKDFMERQYAIVDSKRMPDIVRKLSAVMDQVGKTGALAEFKGADGKYEIPFAKLIELNDKAKIFEPEAMDTIQRNEGMLSPFGIKTKKAIEAGDVERAKQAEKGPRDGAVKQGIDPKTGRAATLRYSGETGEWETSAVSAAKPTKPAATDKPLTLAQENHDERVLKAREAVKGISKEEMLKRSNKYEVSPSGIETGKLNKNYDPDIARNWRLAGEPLFADRKAGREAAKTAPKAAPAVAPKSEPAKAPQRMSDGDRSKVIAEATAAVNKGADPEAVKKRLKEKFGIEVTFGRKK